MKILNAKQIRAVDQATIKNLNIKSIDLMEKAAAKCFEWIELQDHIDENNSIHVFCGMGNNGGDGLALGRMLNLEFYDVKVYTVHFSDTMSDDFIANFNRAEEFEIHPISIHAEDDFPEISANDFVIDAILGSGLNKVPVGLTKKMIHHINQSGAYVISIDIPSGLFIEKNIIDPDSVIKSSLTLSFQLPKLAFLLPENSEYVQRFELLDIGLNEASILSQDTPYHYMKREDIFSFYKKRNKFSHKGNFGHSLIIGGSFGKIGSVSLACKSALKIGSGLVTAYIPKCGYNILQISVSEAMVEVDANDEIEYINFKAQADVIGIGMGMGNSDATSKALFKFLETNSLPIVLDADAINIVAQNKEILGFLNEKSILTPHPKELQRLIGPWKDDFEKLDKLKKLTTDFPFIVVLKGAHTIIVQNGVYYFNSTGSPALATAGSGDVLTGMITGLLAQKYSPLQAAIMGVYLHGLSADVYTSLHPQETFIASDIINLLPGAFNVLLHPEEKIQEEDDDDPDEDFLNDDDDDLPF